MTTVDQLSMDLNAQLAASDAEDRAAGRAYVDPRTVPGRFSLLKQFDLSAAHYEYACQQPQDNTLASKLGTLVRANPNDPGLPLRFGSACHYMLLGDPNAVAVFTGKIRSGKEWLKFRDKSADEGRKVTLNVKEHALAVGVCDSIRRHERAMELLFDGTSAVIEQRIDWQWMGRTMRSTPDARSRSRRYVVDLKTTVSSQPVPFMWHSLRYRYHAQLALYVTALEVAEGWTPDDCYIVAVEKRPPYPVVVRPLTDEAILAGRKLIRTWMEQLLAAERANTYPGYAESDVLLDVPRDKAEDDMPDLVFGEVG